jgi:hypothetical protein
MRQQMSHLQTKKSNFEKQNLMLNEQILHSEENALQKDKNIQFLQSENGQLKELLQQEQVKLNALQLFTSDLQRKFDQQALQTQ